MVAKAAKAGQSCRAAYGRRPTELAAAQRDGGLGVAGLAVLTIDLGMPRLHLVCEIVLGSRPDQAIEPGLVRLPVADPVILAVVDQSIDAPLNQRRDIQLRICQL